MGDFFTPPPGFLPVQPEPETPIPDFTTIAGNIGLGLDSSGTLNKFWNGLVEALVRVVTITLGWILRQVFIILGFIFTLFGKTTEEASLGYGVFVSVMLKDVFGVDVDPSSVNTRRGGPDRQAVANKLGHAIIGTLFSGVQSDPAGGVKASDAAANNFLAVMVNMELNGWVESWFADGISGHLLEKWGELKDGLARTLGLGRLSRQVFGPPLKVLVHDPYLALLEYTYRSKHIPEGVALPAFFRGDIDRTKLSDILGHQGYKEQEIDFLLTQHAKRISDADVEYLIARGIWSLDVGKQYLRQQGWDDTGASTRLQVLSDQRINKYRVELVTVATDAYVRGEVTFDQLQGAIRNSGYSDAEGGFALSVASLKRDVHVTHLSQGQIETGIVDGIMHLNDLKQWADRNNMPADEEAFLELMTLYKGNKQSATAAAKSAAAKAKAEAAAAKNSAAAVKAAAAKAQAADKGVSVAQAETLVKDGLWTFAHLTTFLTARGYAPDAIDAIVQLLHAAIAKTAAAGATASGARSAAASRGLSLAEVEKAVVAGILTIADLESFLEAHHFDAADAHVIVELTQEAIDTANTKAAAKAAATAKAADKQISLPNLEHAVRIGLTPIATYDAALTAAGFDALTVTLMNGLLNAQIAADKAAAAKRTGAAAAGAAAAISISQLEQEVINGIRPIADYTSTLAQLNYNATDQRELTQLLQLKVDAAKLVAEKKAAAGEALAAKGISISQAERAVKLGVIPIATYTSLLRTAGFTQDAIDVLAHTLLAEVAKTSKAQTAATGAAAQLATKGISLPDLERAVIAGVRPIADYTNTLASNGYSAIDVGTLTELLQLKVDQAERAAAAHADAEGKATQKGITLAAEEAAVIAGDLTMANYDALLVQLGYDALDRAILEQLLQTKVAAKAAKAGGSAPAPAVGP